MISNFRLYGQNPNLGVTIHWKAIVQYISYCAAVVILKKISLLGLVLSGVKGLMPFSLSPQSFWWFLY